MTMANNSTPLWLHLKKEYIDDNFEQLLPYLREYAGRKDCDAFYDTTVQLKAYIEEYKKLL